MIRFMISMLVVTLVASTSYAGDAPGWFYKTLEVDDPEQLAYFVTVRDCPVSTEEVQEIVEDVFLDNRITPLKEDIYVYDRVYLNIGVTCVPLKNNNPIFSVMAEYGRHRPYPPVIYDVDFGFIGIGSKDYMERHIKDCTDRALSAFLEANFEY